MEEKKSVDFIKWFSEVNKSSGKIVGGKGANLSEIFNLKIPVPPGFVVTAQAYDYFITEAGLGDKIKNILEKIDYEDTKQLNESTTQIRELIVKSDLPKDMEEDIVEAYEDLGTGEIDFRKGTAHDILKSSAEPIFVAVRSSATTEDLAEASFAGQQDSFVNVKGDHELIKHIKKAFASLFTSRATYYRNKKGFKHEEASLAVVVQKMVDSDKSGVIFSKDPAHKNDNIIMEAVYGLGEGIVSGRITPDTYKISPEMKLLDKKIGSKKIAITRNSSGGREIVKLREVRSKAQVLNEHEIKQLSEFALKLEEHFQKPQDIEFAIEGEEIYIVQTRPITTMENRFEEAKDIKGEPILTGLAASPGIASGKIRIINNLEDLHKIKKGDVLVTKMTDPDMVVSMQKSVAIVTDEGGLTAHAAIVSREMGIPAVVGTQEATTKLKEGEIITVDGFKGKVYKGKTSETVQKEVLPVTIETKTKLKVIVDLPSFAERASRTKLRKVGLTRIEGIIAESGKHPDYFLKENKIQDYEEVIFKGIQDIAKYFDELWIRTSDIRSDEFSDLEGAPKEKEANPMLGMHGIRYGLKNPDVLKAELRALKRVSEDEKKIGLLLPQIISVEEVQKVKEFLKEIDFNEAKVGVMIETPAAVQIIRDLCEEGIDFISFGTNDLTQYMLAVDRGNEQVQTLYNEMHPAILYQLGYVIRVCKRNNVETSICGQAGSKKEMAKFLVENGIDSISVNADMASEIASYIDKIEKELVKDTDKEPRKYQPEKNSSEKLTIEDGKEKTQKEYESTKSKEELDSEQVQESFTKPQNIPEEVSQKDVEEQTQEKESIIDEIKEDVEEIVKDKGGEIPIIRGLEKMQTPEQKEKIEEDIKEIEKEKEEYLEEQVKNENYKRENNDYLENELDGETEEDTVDKNDFDEEPEFNEDGFGKRDKEDDEVLDIF